jgi:uncharacterized protein (UPF0335 family)
MLRHVEAIQRLEKEKKSVMSAIADRYKKAKDDGLDTPTLKEMVKDLQKTPAQRREREAMRQLYRAALGMLDGTPLGTAALERLQERTEQPKGSAPLRLVDEQPDVDVASAEAQGRGDAGKGKPISENPFAPNDPRRAAYDQGWCAAAGVGSAQLPLAFRRDKTASEEEAESASGVTDAEKLLQEGGDKPKRGRKAAAKTATKRGRRKGAEPEPGPEEGDEEQARLH